IIARPARNIHRQRRRMARRAVKKRCKIPRHALYNAILHITCFLHGLACRFYRAGVYCVRPRKAEKEKGRVLNMKKFFAVMLALALCASSASALAASGAITVVSREDGSGTRGAFVELMGVEVKAEDGSKADMTTEEAVIANSTDVVMQNVASDPNAIGYISLGSLNETVKAVSVDGVAPSVETVADGSYKVARPFYIATKGEPGELAADFIAFILSAEGQAVVGESYIKVDDAAPAFEGALPEGKLVIAGSSSVTPVM